MKQLKLVLEYWRIWEALQTAPFKWDRLCLCSKLVYSGSESAEHLSKCLNRIIMPISIKVMPLILVVWLKSKCLHIPAFFCIVTFSNHLNRNTAFCVCSYSWPQTEALYSTHITIFYFENKVIGFLSLFQTELLAAAINQISRFNRIEIGIGHNPYWWHCIINKLPTMNFPLIIKANKFYFKVL